MTGDEKSTSNGAAKNVVREHLDEHPLTREHLGEHAASVKQRLTDAPRRFVSEKFQELMSDEPGAMAQQAGTTREFTVHAIQVDYHMNSYGLHNPRGTMFVLSENRQEARQASGQPLGDGFGLIENDPGSKVAGSAAAVLQPLALRANVGDTIRINFINELDERVGMHVAGLPYDPATSDGMNVGFNPDTTAAPVSTELPSDYDPTTDGLPDEAVTYTWQADNQGTHFITDGANQATESDPNPPTGGNAIGRGLFGAVVVEPPGATWTDPETGEPLRSGVKADIHVPGFPDHREFLVFYHNAEEARPALAYADGEEQAIHALNYRADPTQQRIDDRCADCNDSDTFYSSWVHGDPGGSDLVFPCYSGDPLKIVAVGASIEENHVHHFHNHRWAESPQIPRNDNTRDSETLGLGNAFESFIVVGHGEQSTRPGMTFEEAFDVGAGQLHGGVGDILIHCHLFPHYGEGMTGFVRIHNLLHTDLQQLPNNTFGQNPRLTTTEAEGYPNFVAGEKFQRPPQPPAAGGRPPEPQEEAVYGPNPTPGAPFADPCPSPLPGTTRQYTIVATDADIVYNDAGEHDPDGICFVLEEDLADVQSGRMDPEPLVIRANVGDCVEITLRNELPDEMNPDSAFASVSNHPHFVAFDPLGSDSTMVGYMYDQSAHKNGEFGDELNYRWYADEEGTIFFHDHLEGIEEGMHGAFASIIVEPEGSTWRDPYNGEEIRSGTQAIIENPGGNDFREQVLVYHDFAPLRRQDGGFVNNDREHGVNSGMMAINYRNAPYYNRNDPDPAYVHSSKVHGDPPTPVFETYEGDPMRIRLLQGAYEEQHNFSSNGLRLDPDGLDPEDSVTQIIGTSEGFTLLASELTNYERINSPDGIPVWDHLINSNVMDDLWSGMWGLNRVWGVEVDHLQPLPDRGAPTESLANCQKVLRRMGHPAAYDNRATDGQKDRLLYGPNDDRSSGPPDEGARHNPNVGEIPPKAPSPGDPCPPDTPTRQVNVTAFEHDVRFNSYGDHDPHGVVFALDEYVDDIRNGDRAPEPLALRMREGECLELTLTNALPETRDEDHADPEMPNDQPWSRSNRISLHPQRMSYDDQGSDGATVGFNFDQTVAPGESITYRWYADEPLGNCVLWDMADLRGNRHHGAFGSLIVESEGSTWLDPETGEPKPTGNDAIVKDPNGEDFREFTLSMSDGRYIVNPTGTCVVPPGAEPEDVNAGDPSEGGTPPCNQIGEDEEDHGYVAINNRSEPFYRRFIRASDEPHLVFDSDTHGDPHTPILNAFVGDPVRFRVANTADKANGIAFHLAGHAFPRFVNRPNGGLVGVNDEFSTGKAETIEPVGGAGGQRGMTGDFIYQETKQIRRLEAGFWGIFRVRGQSEPQTTADGPQVQASTADAPAGDVDEPIQPLPDRSESVPLAARPGLTVTTGDVTGSGATDVLVGVPASDVGGVDAGAAYLFTDTAPGAITDLGDADLLLVGSPGDRVGQDVDIGGGGDLVVGTDAGAATVPGGEVGGLIANPPETPIGDVVENTTVSPDTATVPLDTATDGNGGA